MTVSPRRTTGVRHGPRSTQVVERVRAAVLSEITRLGFAGITIDGVARAAGVNRTTIYRRWPTKADLLGAAVEPLLAEFDADPGTGSFRGDLLVLMRRLRDNAARPEGRALGDAVKSSAAELREIAVRAGARTLAPFDRAAEQAAARGEIADRALAGVAAHLAYAGIVMWEQNRGTPATDADCARMLDLALAGLPTVTE
ncbi:TetR/AcrR family transcriptional regulator [Actinoplanes missouriensis]|uniref:TetR/AcrR family transcriptional regulator n=1 Tax=Actinoplanes missouriensis TaxID=1866 RepID=UPI0033F6D108